uniref:Cytidylate kinase n=1 Tax=Candidatus Kentrum sp. MB TaxID=2138164 RepID=A0A450X3I1_9GAMM|nr:MAG: Cytidylate kinase [Candidatus Kentron sp. MB]VFK26726.1 MAG: Cytidylate kinase [Candidatus Kentron sp. MB]VFK74608.1 MAG: Cytidylate kinase [Candidatus Kentron sp. MB]
MNPNIARTIAILTECAQQTDRKRRLGQDQHVIALSSGTGTGGREIGEMLAEHLGVRLYDKEILEEMARETHLNRSILKRLDERIDGLKGAWFRSILTGENFCKENYCRNLVNVILGIACQGGVILGRGSCFILAQYPVLRVHIIGSIERCAARVAAQENIELTLAKQLVKEEDQSRAEYIRKLFNQDDSDSKHFDLVINSDRLPLSYIVDSILQAKKCAKFKGNIHTDLP